MPQFAYTAKDQSGIRSSGMLFAATREAVLDQLAGRGLFPLQLEEQGEEPLARNIPRGRRVPASAVESFTRELANLLAGGIPLARALRILIREASHPAAAAQCQAIHDDVAGGIPLAVAMGQWPKSFGPVYLAMVHAGETGGFLDLVLFQIADFRTRERDLIGKVKTAMIYPCVLTVIAMGVLIFCLTYFIPRFSAIFQQFNVDLPLPTRIVMAISESLWTYGLPAVFSLALGAFLLQRVIAADARRRWIESVTLRAPAVGRIMVRFALVRFTRMLGTLLAAGVPLVAALRVAREVIGIQTLSEAVADAIDQVQRGIPLAKSLARAVDLFPASVVETIAVAEETSRLDTELVRVAETYEKQLDRELRMLVALAEPLILFLMAALVGTVVVAMLLPVFSLQDLIQ